MYIIENSDGVPIVDLGMVLGFWDEYYFSIVKVSRHVALFQNTFESLKECGCHERCNFWKNSVGSLSLLGASLLVAKLWFVGLCLV